MLLAFVFVIIGDHVRPGTQERTRARGAARPVEPAGARDPRRRAEAHRRARRRRRRSPRACRGRPRRRGRDGLPRDESRRGRVAAHRGIGARGEDRRDGTRGAHGRARRRCRRPSCSPARWSCRARAWRACSRPATQTALGRIGSVLAAVRPEPTRIQRETARLVKRLAWCGARIERAGRDRVRTDARRVAQCDPRRHHARDGDPAGGTARRPHRFSWGSARGASRRIAC